MSLASQLQLAMTRIGSEFKTVRTELGTRYVKPSTGIPKGDLTAALQSSATRADLASLIAIDTDGVPYVAASGAAGGVGVPIGARYADLGASRETFRPGVLSNITFDGTTPAFAGQKQITYEDAIAANMARAKGGRLTARPGLEAVRQNVINGTTAQTTAFDISTRLTGQQIAFHFYFWENTDVICYINNQPLTRYTAMNPGLNSVFFSLSFAELDEYDIDISTGRSSGFVQFLIPGSAQIQAPPQRDQWAWISDSWGAGQYGVTSDPVSTFTGTIPHWMKKDVGIELFNLCQGGTGYMNPGNGTEDVSVYGSAARRAALAALPSTLRGVIVFGGGNDGQAQYSTSQITAAAAALYANIATDRPGLPVIVVGAQPGALSIGNTELDRVNGAIKAAADAAPNVRAFIDMRAPGLNLITGTGNNGAKNGTGSADIYVHGDGIHPTPVGHKHIGLWLADQIKKVVI